jgi:protein-tyrosine phosphatase
VGPYVDCHSHVVPSGDDGATSVDHGLELCDSAAGHGTAILFATPHVWPYFTLTEERETTIREAFEQMRPRVELDLRLGYELTPSWALLKEDPTRYVLEGTNCVLMEVPFTGPAKLVFALAEHVEAEGLRPVIAHPERTEAVLEDHGVAEELAARGWTLQVNSTSLLGRHGPHSEQLAWSLLERGLAGIVGSDGHRATRPAHLDEAHALAERRLGRRALPLFDGSALGVSMQTCTASRATSRDA